MPAVVVAVACIMAASALWASNNMIASGGNEGGFDAGRIGASTLYFDDSNSTDIGTYLNNSITSQPVILNGTFACDINGSTLNAGLTVHGNVNITISNSSVTGLFVMNNTRVIVVSSTVSAFLVSDAGFLRLQQGCTVQAMSEVEDNGACLIQASTLTVGVRARDTATLVLQQATNTSQLHVTGDAILDMRNSKVSSVFNATGSATCTISDSIIDDTQSEARNASTVNIEGNTVTRGWLVREQASLNIAGEGNSFQSGDLVFRDDAVGYIVGLTGSGDFLCYDQSKAWIYNTAVSRFNFQGAVGPFFLENVRSTMDSTFHNSGEIYVQNGSFHRMVTVSGNGMPVVFTNCTFTGTQPGPGNYAMQVTSSGAITATGCRFEGYQGLFLTDGTAGIFESNITTSWTGTNASVVVLSDAYLVLTNVTSTLQSSVFLTAAGTGGTVILDGVRTSGKIDIGANFALSMENMDAPACDLAFQGDYAEIHGSVMRDLSFQGDGDVLVNTTRARDITTTGGGTLAILESEVTRFLRITRADPANVVLARDSSIVQVELHANTTLHADGCGIDVLEMGDNTHLTTGDLGGSGSVNILNMYDNATASLNNDTIGQLQLQGNARVVLDGCIVNFVFATNGSIDAVATTFAGVSASLVLSQNSTMMATDCVFDAFMNAGDNSSAFLFGSTLLTNAFLMAVNNGTILLVNVSSTTPFSGIMIIEIQIVCSGVAVHESSQAFFDGGSIEMPRTETSFTVELNTYYKSDGPHLFEVEMKMDATTNPGHHYRLGFTVQVLNVPDAPPAITSSENMTYYYGAPDPGVWFEIEDLNGVWCTATLNTAIVLNASSWTRNLRLDYTLAGRDVGVYNFTVIANDTFGQVSRRSVIVTIMNIVPQFEQKAANFTFVAGLAPAAAIWWIPTDSNPGSFIVWSDEFSGDTNVLNGTWTSGQNITYSVAHLPAGSYMFSLWVNDTLGLMNQSIITVHVYANTAPYVDDVSPSDVLAIDEGEAVVLEWTIADDEGNGIDIRITVSGDATWDSGHYTWPALDVVQLGINNATFHHNVSLGVGTYTITLHLNDTLGVSSSHVVTVTVANVDPTFSATPQATVSLVEGATASRTLSYTVQDPGLTGTYVILVNGTQVANGAWTSGTPFSYVYATGSLAVGDYNVTVVVTDAHGGTVSFTTIVRITAAEVPDGGIPGFPVAVMAGCMVLGVLFVLRKRQHH